MLRICIRRYLLSFFLIFTALSLAACGSGAAAPATEPTPSPLPTELAPVERDYTGLRLSELMYRNRCSVRDENGQYNDWAELCNDASEPVSLSGLFLSDGSSSWALPERELAPEAYLLLYCGGEGELHAPFALSEGETLSLVTASGKSVAACVCEGTEKEQSLVLSADSPEYLPSDRLSPGFANTPEGYDSWQESLPLPESLCISEVVSDGSEYFGDYDWVELYNASSGAVSTSGCALSDDPDELSAFPLPARELAPGERLVVPCGASLPDSAPFSLSSQSDRLFLSRGEELLDAVALHGIPAGGSFGRIEGRPGWFYFGNSSENEANGTGRRRVSEAPSILSGSGVFSSADPVSVELSAPGEIRYSTDGSDPLVSGQLYSGPFSVDRSCVIRACAQEEGALPSRCIVFDCLLGEELSLPALSLCFDSFSAGKNILHSQTKLMREQPATLSLYEEGGSFSVRCGVNLAGAFSLTLPQKSFKIHFRSRYGDGNLNYDLFGDGVEEFSSLTLRKGQDSTVTVFRTEMWEDLCRSVSDRVLTQRSRFCILYVDGEYYGICSLREDFSRQFYASHCGVSKDSVEWEKLPFAKDGAFEREVLSICRLTNGKLSDEQYAQLSSVLDIDSMIDWMILQGVSGNTDFFTNGAFFRSSENGGKWQAAFFDLDHAFETPFIGMFTQGTYSSHQITRLCWALCSNSAFADRFLTRYAQLWNTSLSSDAILERMDYYEELLAPEIERDFQRWHYSNGTVRWQFQLDKIRKLLSEGWETRAVENLFIFSGIDRSLRDRYFKD